MIFSQKIQYFMAMARFRSFREASERIGLSQPALTIAIAQLEEELGWPLFKRSKKGIVLTPKGESFLKHLNVTRQSFLLAMEGLTEHPTPIRMGATISFTHKFIYPSFKKLMAMFGPIQLSVVRSLDMVHAVERNDLEFAIVGLDKKPKQIRAMLLYEDPVFIVGKKGNFRSLESAKNLEDLEDESWVHFPSPLLDWTQVLTPGRAGFVTNDVFEFKKIILEGYAIGEAQINLFSKKELESLYLSSVKAPSCGFSIYLIFAKNISQRAEQMANEILKLIRP